jgi:hypothetical protein
MTDDRLFPGWDTMLWPSPLIGEWISMTPGWLGEDLVSASEPHLRTLLREQCRYYSTIGEGPFFEVLDGVIVAEWWQGVRWPVESDL